MKTLLLKIFLLSFVFSNAQNDILLNASNSIKIDELKEKLYIYSSDEFEGRGTPSKGQELAVEYLANHYKNLGIPSVKKNSYLQAVPLQLESKPDISLSISDNNFTYYDDYISYSNGADMNYDSVDMIFVGFGIDDPEYSDYIDKDVKGKIVVVSGGEPLNKDEDYFINGNNKSKWSNSREEISLKKNVAKRKGALAMILVDESLHRVKFLGLDC